MRKLLPFLLVLLVLSSCVGNSAPRQVESTEGDSTAVSTIVTVVDTAMTSDTTLMALTPLQVDSMVFRLTHHYSENFNFLVSADSLTLVPREGDFLTDTCRVYRGDVVVVAEIKPLAGSDTDTVWVKVAGSQTIMGWIREDELLAGTTPDDVISQMLDLLSDSRAVWMSAFVLLGAVALLLSRRKGKGLSLFTHFPDEMSGPYPPLFLLLVGVMASLYASVQNFVPEFWQEYYFHPTLNPLVLPPVMAALVVVMWLVIIVFLAVVDEVYHHFYFVPGVVYLAKLVGASMVVYLVVSWTTLFYVGYFLLAILVWCLTAWLWKAVK